MEIILDTKRKDILNRAIGIFGDALELKKDLVIYKLKTTYEIDYTEYTDEMIKNLLNNVIYN